MCIAWQQNMGQLGEVPLCIDIKDPYVKNVVGNMLMERCFSWSTLGLTGIFFPRSGNQIWDQELSPLNTVASLSRTSYCYFPD